MTVIATAANSSPVGSPIIPNHQFTRLHITPFNSNLLSAIIPPSILPSIKNVSYHSMQTFPEKSYGFVEMPKMDAEKIKKKLNGSILKGSKVRIEEARPSKERVFTPDLEGTLPTERKEEVEKGSRKRKRHEKVLPGVELRDRKVQRGWTSVDTKKSDKRLKEKKEKKPIPAKSKFTSQPECLFKTSLPENIAAHLKEDPGLSSLQRKKSSRSGKEVVVHEFEKTTKHATFLRGSGVAAGSSAVSEYVEGKGWVDKDGKVVEVDVPKKKKTSVVVRHVAVDPVADSSSSVSDTSEEEDSSEDKDSSEDEVEDSIMKTPTPVVREASVTSSSGSSSDEEEDEQAAESTSSSGSSSESEDEASPQAKEQESRPTTSSGPHPNLTLQIPSVSTTPIQVHPLEALYKKSKADDNATADTQPFSFSFNDTANDDIDTSDQTHAMPMTPFTKQDFEHRGYRSAAPTPDTAHPGKNYTTWPSISKSSINNYEDEEEEEDESGIASYAESPIPNRSTRQPPISNAAASAIGETEAVAPESDFTKWFYEHRGEANRAWKKRRKVVSKEKRHRENKSRGPERAV